MGLRDIGASLPPGFRFYPSDEELVCHYLRKKIANQDVSNGTLVEVDLHICEPWELPEVTKLNSNEWYFFSFRDRKYATGFRANRATASGYWKATGKDRLVRDPKTRGVVGMRKTLVFYINRAPNGTKTGWIMHEFRLETPNKPPKEDWVLCRVFNKVKSENNYKIGSAETAGHLSSQNILCTTNDCHPTDSTFQTLLNQHEDNIYSNTLFNLPLVTEDDYVKLSNDDNEAPPDNVVINAHPSEEDDFGFLLDLTFQEHMVTTNYENTTFQEDTNSSLVRG